MRTRKLLRRFVYLQSLSLSLSIILSLLFLFFAKGSQCDNLFQIQRDGGGRYFQSHHLCLSLACAWSHHTPYLSRKQKQTKQIVRLHIWVFSFVLHIIGFPILSVVGAVFPSGLETLHTARNDRKQSLPQILWRVQDLPAGVWPLPGLPGRRLSGFACRNLGLFSNTLPAARCRGRRSPF